MGDNEKEKLDLTVTETECPICNEEITDPAFLYLCLHVFCSLCIWKWFEKSKTCPICTRKPDTVLSGFEKSTDIIEMKRSLHRIRPIGDFILNQVDTGMFTTCLSNELTRISDAYTSSICHRRCIYEDKCFVKPNVNDMTRSISPETIRTNIYEQERVEAWVKRDLYALGIIGDDLKNEVLKFLKKYRPWDPRLTDVLMPHLGNRYVVYQFIHELYFFLVSRHNRLLDYDVFADYYEYSIVSVPTEEQKFIVMDSSDDFDYMMTHDHHTRSTPSPVAGPSGVQCPIGPARREPMSPVAGPSGVQRSIRPARRESMSPVAGPSGVQRSIRPARRESMSPVAGPSGVQSLTGPARRDTVSPVAGPSGMQPHITISDSESD